MTRTGIESGTLEEELRARFKIMGNRCMVTTTDCFLDFLWDPGMEFDELSKLDRPVVVDSLGGPRRIVVQRVRGELRYWLATDRDPMVMSRTGEGELGVVGSVDDVVSLCSEFLDSDIRIVELVTPRRRGAKDRDGRGTA